MITTFKIGSGVKLHPAIRKKGMFFDIVSNMKFGDSVLVPNRAQAMQLCLAIAKQDGATASQRKQPDGSIRVWKLQSAYKNLPKDP